MIRSLRKGRSSVYFQHANTGHSIGAEKYECEVTDGKAILRFSLNPVDGNQRMDEDHLHIEKPLSIDVDDGSVIDSLLKYLNARRQEFSSWEVQVLSRGKTFSFAVDPDKRQYEARHVLRLIVHPAGS